MNTIVCFTLLIGLVCFVQKAHSRHIEETGDDEEMERRRTYCIKISRVSKRDTLELRPVVCEAGYEFCFTSTTCCCKQIPENKNSIALPIGLGVGGFLLVSILFFACYACLRRPQRFGAPPSAMSAATDRRSVSKPPLSDSSSISNYRSKYDLSPSYYGAPSEKYGPPSSRYGYPPGERDNDSLDSFDIGKVARLSISGTLPPPPYSEHSFAFGPGPAGPVALYKTRRDSDLSSHGYTKRSSRRSSATSWLRAQDGAPSQSRRSSLGSIPSVIRNSRSVSRAGSVANAGFEPERDQQHYMMTIPSVRSSAGSTVAASEVIYNSVGARSEAGGRSQVGGASSIGRHSRVSTARNA